MENRYSVLHSSPPLGVNCAEMYLKAINVRHRENIAKMAHQTVNCPKSESQTWKSVEDIEEIAQWLKISSRV